MGYGTGRIEQQRAVAEYSMIEGNPDTKPSNGRHSLCAFLSASKISVMTSANCCNRYTSDLRPLGQAVKLLANERDFVGEEFQHRTTDVGRSAANALQPSRERPSWP